MTLTAVLDVVIGMAFIYMLLCIFVSGVNEWLAQTSGSRGEYLRRALVRLIGDEGIYRRLIHHPLIGSLYRERTAVGKPPSYIPSTSFVTALIDVLQLRAARLRGMPPPPTVGTNELRQALEILAANNQVVAIPLLPIVNRAQGDWQQTLNGIEDWFNSGMDRASGWYKEHARRMLFLLGLFVAVITNVDSIQLVQTLWNSRQLRADVAADATQAVKTGQAGGAALSELLGRPATPEETARVATTFRNMEARQLPIGFSCLGEDPLRPTVGVVNRCATNLKSELEGAWGVKLLGWLITAVAVSLGAPFWFQLLNRFVDLRGAGKKPDETTSR